LQPGPRQLAPDLLVEDAVFLCARRAHLVAAPHVRLADLVRLDEQMDAVLDLLAQLRSAAMAELARLPRDEPGMAFATVMLAVGQDPTAVAHAFRPGGTLRAETPDGAWPIAREAVAALALAPRNLATPALQGMLSQADPLSRAIAIAALGTRRADPGEALGAALGDPAPLVRARACRVAGLLGRTGLLPRLLAALAEEDPECRFQAAWAAARLGAAEPLGVLGQVARTDHPRAEAALGLLLRRLPLAEGNAWLAAFARDLPARRRSLIRATGILGDPRYVPWLLERMRSAPEARLAGEALSMITGLDLAYLDLDRDAPEDFESGPNDDPRDEDVALDEDGDLPWPDPDRLGAWWASRRAAFPAGTAFFLGRPKEQADWLGALSDGFQRQRLAAALELAIRQPAAAMFEARAHGRLQRRLLVGAARSRQP
jgi:uncharacterized protein (TIGR02270 family)